MISCTPTRTIELDHSKTREQRILEGMAAWVSFYRENPHRFVKDYLNINLKPFQQILLLEMDQNNYTAYIASRGRYHLASLFRNKQTKQPGKIGEG